MGDPRRARGITGDPYLVFANDAFALLGLRALYSLLEGASSTPVHLSSGLSFILASIGVKLLLHWAHDIWTWAPEIPTLASLFVIVGAPAVVTVTSVLSNRRAVVAEEDLPQEEVRAAQDAERSSGTWRSHDRAPAPSRWRGASVGRGLPQSPFAALNASMTSALMRPRSDTW